MRYIYLIFMLLLAGKNQAQLPLSKEESVRLEKKSRALSSLAVEYFKKNNLTKSTELLFEAKEVAEKTNNYELIAKTYGSISHQYIQLNLNDKAKEYLNKAIEQTNKLPEGDPKKTLKGLSYLELGNIDFDEKKYLGANNNYKKSLKEFQLLKHSLPIVYHYRRSLYNIGESYFLLKKNDSAEWYLNKALRVKDEANKELKLYIYNSLSKVYTENGDKQRAIDSLQVILNDPNLENVQLKSEVYYNLAQNYKALGNSDDYFVYNEKYINSENSIKENELKGINSAMNAEQKDFKSVISKADQNNKRFIYTSILFIILFLSVIFYLMYKRKKEKNAFELIIKGLTNLSPNSPELKTAIQLKNETVSSPSVVENEILSRLSKFEDSQKFTNPKLNISNLAVQLKTNTSYLSDVINKYKGKNFNTYINDLRINYICDKIYNNEEYQKYKISYLAEECGFTSHSAFATVFKNTTGISPSIFLREAVKKSTAKKSNF